MKINSEQLKNHPATVVSEKESISDQNTSQKKRIYSQFSDSNNNDDSQQQDRKKRKQQLPHKMDQDSFLLQSSEKVKKTTISSSSNVVAQQQGQVPVKSFQALKEKRRQQQQQQVMSVLVESQKADKYQDQQVKSLPFESQYNIQSQVDKLETQYNQNGDDNQQQQKRSFIKKLQKNQTTGAADPSDTNNLNQKFDQNLNFKSINDIDQHLLKQNQLNQKIKKQNAEQQLYINYQELPNDWSIKQSIDISCIINSENDKIDFNFSKIQKFMQYYIYNNESKSTGFENIIDKEQLKLQQKIQWLKSFRDVYQKFLSTAASASSDASNGFNRNGRTTNGIGSVAMPFFYVRNNNFIALFKLEEGKLPKVILNPSKNLAKIIQDSNVIKTVVNISHDEDEERDKLEQQKKNQMKDDSEDDDDLIDDQDRLKFLLENDENEQHFTLQTKNQSQLYYFDNKAVQSIYNIIANFIANQIDAPSYVYSNSVTQASAQIIAPAPFINCTYNESQVFYSGNVAYANKKIKYQMKIFGIIFPYHFQNLCQVVKSQFNNSNNYNNDSNSNQQRDNNNNNSEVEILMKSDEQSKLFSYKKCIKLIKMATNNGSNNNGYGSNQPYKLMFD